MNVFARRTWIRGVATLVLAVAVSRLALTAAVAASLPEGHPQPEPLVPEEIAVLERLEMESQWISKLCAGGEDDQGQSSVVPWIITGASALIALLLGGAIVLNDTGSDTDTAAKAAAGP